MTLSLRQTIFFLLFATLFLLLLLLGESFLALYILAACCVLFYLFRKKIDFTKINNYYHILIYWFIFLVALFLSALFSASLPLTLHSLLTFSFYFIFFFFFLLLKPKFLKEELFIWALLSIAVVLVFLSIGFLFFPNLAILLPSVNVFHASNGHNHLAAFLLLVIPVAWHFAFKEKKLLLFLLLTVLTIALLFSFGRVAVVIGFGQFLYLFYLYKKKIFSNKKLRLFFLVLLFSFASFIVFTLFFSFKLIQHPSICNRPVVKKLLCKELTKQTRTYYWQQALLISKDNLLFGLGPGTYSLGSYQYRQTPEFYSTFAHNAFLQMFAELGLVGGGAYLFLMLFLLYKAWRVSQKKPQLSITRSLFIGVAAIYIDILFDFDWSFSGVFCLTLLFLALIIKSEKILLEKKASFWYRQLSVFIYYLLNTVLVFFTTIYLLTAIILNLQGAQAAFDFFPYFHWHSVIFAQDVDLKPQSQTQLWQIYNHHREINMIFLDKNIGGNQQSDLLTSLIKIDPWQQVLRNRVDEYFEEDNLQRTEDELNNVYDFLESKQKRYDYNIEFVPLIIRDNLANKFLFFADKHYQNKNYELAGVYYQRAQFLSPWILHDYKPIFIDNFVASDEQIIFFEHLATIDSAVFGDQRQVFSTFFIEMVNDQIKLGKSENINFLMEKAISLDPKAHYTMWENITNPSLQSIQIAINAQDFALARKRTLALYQAWFGLESYKEKINKEKQLELAQFLILLSENTAVKEEFYQKAITIFPWIVSDED